MTEIAAFIRARLEEWAEWAEVASETRGGEWVLEEVPSGWGADQEPDILCRGKAVLAATLDKGSPAAIQHAVLHDPARVLRQVEAMRRVVDACEPDHRDAMESGDDSTALATDALRLLASTWSDHAEYKAGWAP